MKDLFSRISIVGWLQAVLSAFMIGLFYHSTLYRLIFKEWKRQDFDYCYLIPFVIAYLLWEVRHKFFERPSQPTAWGIIPLAIGLLFYLIGEFGGEFLIQYISLYLVVFGLCWAVFGWKRFSVIAIPVSFMLAAFPPPHFIYSKLTISMQLLSTKISAGTLRMLNIPVYQRGNVLDLGVEQLQVVDACSGLRFLIPMAIVALLLAYLYKNKWWKRLLVLFSAIPLAVVLNGIRIGIIGYLVSEVDAAIAEGPVHDLTGWIMFFVGTGIMFGLTIFFSKLETPADNLAGNTETITDEIAQTDKADIPLLPVPFISALLLILVAFVFIQLHGDHVSMKTPEIKDFDTFPITIGDWSGTDQPLSRRIIRGLDLTDYIQIDYKAPSAGQINFYVAWYASQTKGESIHSPESCLLGGGWRFQDKRETKIDISGYAKSPLRVNRVVLKQGEARMLGYFWFPCRGRILTNAYELKLYTFWDNLTRGRTDGALVRVITAVGPDEDTDAAENRLKAFLGKALPVLDEYLPDK